MIGVTGSGKTSFLAGLYESLEVNEVEGYHIKTDAQNFHDSIINIGHWQEISFSDNELRFPAGTQQTKLWPCSLHHQSNFVCDIELLDYRGGIIKDISESKTDNTRETQLKEILQHIRFSDAVILFVDSIILTQPGGLKRGIAQSGINRIYEILEAYDRYYPNRSLNITAALTKADAVNAKWLNNDYKPLYEIGDEALRKIARLISRNDHWNAGLVFISSVGEGKADTKVNYKQNHPLEYPSVETELIAYPEPMNIEQVLFHSIGQTLQERWQNAQKQIETYEEQIIRLEDEQRGIQREIKKQEERINQHKYALQMATDEQEDKVFLAVEWFLSTLSKILAYPFTPASKVSKGEREAIIELIQERIQMLWELNRSKDNSIREKDYQRSTLAQSIDLYREHSQTLCKYAKKKVRPLGEYP